MSLSISISILIEYNISNIKYLLLVRFVKNIIPFYKSFCKQTDLNGNSRSQISKCTKRCGGDTIRFDIISSRFKLCLNS